MEKIIEIIYNSLPYNHQIEKLEIEKDLAIRFTWRGTRYRVSESLLVEEVGDGVLAGTDKAILIERLIKNEQVSMTLKNKD